MSGLMKRLCIHENSWARYYKICDVLDLKLEQTKVFIFSFSMKIFGLEEINQEK